MSVRVKICGVTRIADAECAIGLGADIIGLNFYPLSPRSLSLEQALQMRAAIGDRCQVAGVFVNADRAYIEEHLEALRLDWIQFHGDEPDDALRGWPVKVIRALRLKAAAAPSALVHTSAEYLLIDTFHPGLFGGTGQALSLDGLKDADLSKVFLSGGLAPDSVADVAALAPFCLDVASGVESAPGIKDPDKLRSFIANAKSAR
jgi:phosphoribosylanthranilate isomerase